MNVNGYLKLAEQRNPLPHLAGEALRALIKERAELLDKLAGAREWMIYQTLGALLFGIVAGLMLAVVIVVMNEGAL